MKPIKIITILSAALFLAFLAGCNTGKTHDDDLPKAMQAAEELLSSMTTLFGYAQEEVIDATPTGRFIVPWDYGQGQGTITNEPPEIYQSLTQTGELAFFDSHGNQIHEAPWLIGTSHARHFHLYDFDGNGIPTILVYFTWMSERGLQGNYQIYRYINGEYRRLPLKAFENGIETPDPWLNYAHDFLMDDTGRIITFINSERYWARRYEQLILTDEYAELHLITAFNRNNREAWHEHHWQILTDPHELMRTWPEGDWLIDSWLNHNPAIFGTNIPLTVIKPLDDLKNELTALILEARQK
jgi:hypothetical protein